LAHILNRCTGSGNWTLFTKRHNKVVDIIRKAIESNIANELVETIKENTPIILEGTRLSDEVRLQRPDLTVIRKEGNKMKMEIVEITCPYGRISEERNTMESAFEFKMNKYQKLADEIEEKTEMEVRIIPVIVSSMGSVYSKTMMLLKKLLKCEDRKMKKIGRKMSEAAIYGSFEVWRRYISAKERPIEENVEAEKMIEEEIKDINKEVTEEDEERDKEIERRNENREERTQEEWSELAGEEIGSELL
jgi:hypothetical protein